MTSQKENLVLAAMAVLILAVIGAMGFWLWIKFAPPEEENKVSIVNLSEEQETGEQENENNIQAAPLTSEEPASSADKKAISPADVNVKVLNGGAPAGSAAKIRDLLKNKGYTKIEAANANLSNYMAVTIYHQAEFKSEAEKIKEALAGQYKTIVLKEGMAVQEVNGNIVIILGK